MLAEPRLLVVDDEELYCEACRRIFSRQGFVVEKSQDARRGLELAESNDYSAILLDVRMPEMDGLEFLRNLRATKPDVPVILMTGFPTIPGAASAVRLKASDYVTKPFTPEEITQAVRNLLNCGQSAPLTARGADPWTPASSEVRFLGRSWAQPGVDTTYRVGAVLPRSRVGNSMAATLPRIGEVVYRGLPLMDLNIAGDPCRVAVSPLSGVVVAVNPAVADHPELLWSRPCSEGWVAAIAPTRPEEHWNLCRPRNVVLVSRDSAAAGVQARQLAELGCRVRIEADAAAMVAAALNDDQPVLIFDEASLGAYGPAWAERLKMTVPAAKTLVLGTDNSPWETAYRQQKIFFYAIRPFDDYEITEVLDAMFCPGGRSAIPEAARTPSEPMRGILVRNHQGRKVYLAAFDGALRAHRGLGCAIRKRLLDRLLPIETYLGDKPFDPAETLKTAKTVDHLFALMVKDMGRIPGTLVREQENHAGWTEGRGSNVTVWHVQPETHGPLLEGLPLATIEGLADLIVEEIANA